MFNIRENSIRRKIKKLEKKSAERSFVVKPVKKVAILNNPASNLSFENLKFVQRTLGLRSGQFEIFTFKHKTDSYNELRGIVASKEIIGTFGSLKSPEITAFLEKEYDLLLDFTAMSNIYEKFFFLSIQANCRVGYFNEDELYDLMLNIPVGDIKNFALETRRYLNIMGLLTPAAP